MGWPVTGKRCEWNGVVSPGLSVATRTRTCCFSPFGMPCTISLTIGGGGFAGPRSYAIDVSLVFKRICFLS